MGIHHRRIGVSALALVIAALLASVASAQPIDPVGQTSQPAAPTRDLPAAPREVRVVNVSADSAFDWGDAGIGAALAVTIVALGSVLVVSARRREGAAA